MTMLHSLIVLVLCAQPNGEEIKLIAHRGGVVDEASLISALEQKSIAGAGLDVFEIEPLPVGHPLTKLDNVVLSPHAGGMAYNATMRGLEMSIENLEAFAAGHPIFVVARGTRFASQC